MKIIQSKEKKSYHFFTRNEKGKLILFRVGKDVILKIKTENCVKNFGQFIEKTSGESREPGLIYLDPYNNKDTFSVCYDPETASKEKVLDYLRTLGL